MRIFPSYNFPPPNMTPVVGTIRDSGPVESPLDAFYSLPFDAVKDLPYDAFMAWQGAQERSRKERKVINGLRVVA